MYCNKCGSQLPDDSKFCLKCGSSISVEFEETIQSELKEQEQAVNLFNADSPKNNISAKNILVVSVVLIFVFVVILIFALFSSPSNGSLETTVKQSAVSSFGNEVSLDDLPEKIFTLIHVYNIIITDSSSQIGVSAPIRNYSNDFIFDNGNKSFSFRQAERFVSLHISSSAPSSSREKDLNHEFFNFSLCLFNDFDYDLNYLSWKKITAGESYTREGVILGYVTGDDLDILTFLIPNDMIIDRSDITIPVSSDSTTAENYTTVTLGMKNALSKAKDYLDYTAFSKSGLFEQLKYEGFSDDEANYGVENCGADWMEQAAKKAQEYLDYTSFSRSGLIDQLLYEGFSQEEAEYGVSAVGY